MRIRAFQGLNFVQYVQNDGGQWGPRPLVGDWGETPKVLTVDICVNKMCISFVKLLTNYKSG